MAHRANFKNAMRPTWRFVEIILIVIFNNRPVTHGVGKNSRFPGMLLFTPHGLFVLENLRNSLEDCGSVSRGKVCLAIGISDTHHHNNVSAMRDAAVVIFYFIPLSQVLIFILTWRAALSFVKHDVINCYIVSVGLASCPFEDELTK